MHPQSKMRSLWCALSLGWRGLDSAFPEREANPVMHTLSLDWRNLGSHSQNEMRTALCTLILAWRNSGFAFPERDANHMAHTHSGLVKLKFCIPRTRCEPYGARSLWVGEAWVWHSQNEMRTLWNALSPGSRNLGVACPARDANPMAHTHSRFAKPKCCIPRARCAPDGTHSSGLAEAMFCIPERDASHMVHIHVGFVNLKIRIPGTRCEPYTAHSSGLAQPRFCIPRTRREPYGADSFCVCET